MLKKGEVKMIHKMLLTGLSKSEVARKLGINRNTVIKYSKLPEGYLPTIKRAPAITIVDPYLPDIARMLEEANKMDIHIPVSAIYKEIKKLGYSGGLRRVHEITRRHKLRERVKEEETLIRFETDRAHQMQVDWVEFRKDGLSAFVATMGYSRVSYVEYVTDERVDTLIKCHINAFNYFGGVPKEGLYDNMKTVIIKRNVYGAGKHKFNEQFRDFAKHCGMELKVAPEQSDKVPLGYKPYRAQTKGKVERFNHFLRYSFHNVLKVRLAMMGYKINLENANAEVMDWLTYDANARIHKTTLKVPFDLLEEEQPHLLPLPKTYKGIHPLKVTAQSLAQPELESTYDTFNIPNRDMQAYDNLIPLVALSLLSSVNMGGIAWS
ncbi:MAG: IS21 family transposase [Helicobacteraceae bacterium]|nr:IS21 family transposase [Helicobacteraceae bacterium]